MNNINLSEYQKFVESLTSQASNDLNSFIGRCDELDANYVNNGGQGPNINVPLLLTAALGLAAETGEFCEVPKKIYFQGKPLTDEAVFHMKRELGDVMWYWVNACRALGFDPYEVIQENIDKLSKRYPGGFSVDKSENRAEKDI